MDLEGELGRADVLSTLIELARRKFTGAVRFEHDAVIKIIYFKDGDVLSASTNDPVDAIDETLVRTGTISRDHVRQAMSKRREDESIADSLLSLGFISRKELAWARRLQLVGILRSVLDWKEGTFSSVEGHQPKRDEGTIFHLPQIIVEAAVTDTNRERVERMTDGGAAVYEKTPYFDQEFEHLGLNEDAAAIAQRIDGRTTASDLAAASAEAPFAVLKLLVALEALGMVRRADKPQVMHELLKPQGKPEVFTEMGVLIEDEFVQPPPKKKSAWAIVVPLVLLLLVILGAWYATTRTEPEAATATPGSPVVAAEQATTATIPPTNVDTLEPTETITPVRPASEPPNTPVLPAPTTTQPPAAIPPATIPTATSVAASRPATSTTTTQPPARDLLRERYDVMAETWARERAATPYAIQISISCQTPSITRSLEIGGARIWFVPIQFRGQSCYRVFWGSFDSRAAAEQAVAEIPAVFREGRPAVINVRQVLAP